ncbi:MAG: class I tRNA ligase family protein, partial [Propionibacteriaceae bacterium]|nr:class I tRNA ligase family protein [Propionibacteriaceae bacterium]
IAQALSLVAPYVAEEMWEGLGYQPSVANSTWPTADPALLVRDFVVLVVQVQGKVRGKFDVSPDISEAEAETLVLADPGILKALDGRAVAKVIMRLPKLVSIVPVVMPHN